MRFRMAVLGTVFCLASFAQGQKPAKPTNQSSNKTNQTTSQQSANRMKRADTGTDNTVVGCVDQRGSDYYLRNSQSGELVKINAPGSDEDSWFAKHVGHQVQASGSKSGETLNVSGIHQVADMCGTRK